MNLNQVLEAVERRKARKRRGRGEGSGLGKAAGRGNKGAKARSGWRRRYGYEGGQMPLSRRVPKHGFNNFNFATYFDVVNVGELDKAFEGGARVDLQALTARGVLRPRFERLKILGDGSIGKKLEVIAHSASAAARKKIEAAGGSLQCLIPPRKVRKPPPRPAPAGKAAEKATEKAPEKAAEKAAGKAPEKARAEKPAPPEGKEKKTEGVALPPEKKKTAGAPPGKKKEKGAPKGDEA